MSSFQPVTKRELMRFSGSPDTDVGLLWSAALGVLLTLAAYAALWATRQSAVSAMFFQKSNLIFWVPPLEVYLTSWGMSVLFLKYRLRRKQERFLRRSDLLDLPERITAADVPSLLARLDQTVPRWSESLLLHRVGRLLSHFQTTQDRSEVSALSTAQSDIDGTTLRSSYAMVKVFVWATPILGFIGTVIGLQEAIRGFAGLSNVDRLQEQLAPITGGLGGAFQATLIALAFSLLLMFPSSASEKAEWRFLNLVDDFCNDQVLRRLVVVVTPVDETDPLDEEKLKTLARAVAKEMADSITLTIPKLTETLYSELFSKERVETLVAELYRNFLIETGKAIQDALTSEATGVKSLTAAIQEDTKQRIDETKQRSEAGQLQSDLVRKMSDSQNVLIEAGRLIPGALAAQATGVKNLAEAMQEEAKQRLAASQMQADLVQKMSDSQNVLVEAGRVIQGALAAQATGVRNLTEAIQEEAKQRLAASQMQSEIIRKMSDSQSALQECSASLRAAMGGISQIVRHVDAHRELTTVQAALQRVSSLLGGSPTQSEKSLLTSDGRGARG